MKQTPTGIRFKIVIQEAGNLLGQITPAADRPATAVLYAGTGGANGCASFVSVSCTQNAAGTRLNCS